MNKLVSLLIMTLSYVTISCFLFTCCSCSTTKETTYTSIPSYEEDCEASSLFKEFRYIVDNVEINEDITDIDTVKVRYDYDDQFGRIWKITTIILNPSLRGYIEIEEFNEENDDPELNHVIWWLYDTKSNREDIEHLMLYDAPAKGDWVSCKSDKTYASFIQKGITAIRELYSDKLNTNQNGKLYLITNDYNKIGLYYCTYIE